MKIRWSPEAAEDLESLCAYIAEDNPVAARRVALHIIREIELQLPKHAHMGRPGRVPGTRELIVSETPYIVPYRVRGEIIQVLRVYHSSRRWPDRF